MNTTLSRPVKNNLARTGLTAKGIVYVLLGLLAFMAAFELGGHSNNEASRSGVFRFVKDGPGGTLLLVLLGAGLLCYSVWRISEAFANTGGAQKKEKAKRVLYLLSGLAYLSVALSALLLAFQNKESGGGDQNQQLAMALLRQPFGGWLTGLAALILAGIGLYQIWFGFSEKYRKYVQGLSLHQSGANLMLTSGKVGYVARGVVWLIVAWLLLKAALHHKGSEAGNTTKAFSFVESITYGSYLLAAIGFGLAAYGIFNFIRARYERL